MFPREEKSLVSWVVGDYLPIAAMNQQKSS